ncbi:MAG TPA: transglycosylase SLT domain-containing protein [Pyrinomonadaceae bacterium]|nr:transglycosylase SLT domain-containing protein [Pyrinomonadaceae bacterium]
MRIEVKFNILRITLLVLLSLTVSSNVCAVPVATQTSPPSPRSVVARTGDTIKKIAHRYGVPATELAKLNNLSENERLPKGTRITLPSDAPEAPVESGEVIGKTITLADGYTFQADEVWQQNGETWYRKGNITRSLDREIKSVKPIVKAAAEKLPKEKVAKAPETKVPPTFWINLVDGARFRVDEVQETADGAWYTRQKISIFVEKDRIAKIEREEPSVGNIAAVVSNRDWTSGNPGLDQLIRQNGVRYGIDPYLVFLVIEQESHFRVRAVSPKGALGLMQLMPGTARRLGVTRPFDAADNIRGGTRYLKELMDMFGGQVNLVLASYNAGEGAVLKYGRNVPPYRETRDYVKTIGKRYGLAGRKPDGESEPTPQR